MRAYIETDTDPQFNSQFTAIEFLIYEQGKLTTSISTPFPALPWHIEFEDNFQDHFSN